MGRSSACRSGTPNRGRSYTGLGRTVGSGMLVPTAASRKEMVTWVSTSAPRDGRAERAVPPARPKVLPKRSPKPPPRPDPAVGLFPRAWAKMSERSLKYRKPADEPGLARSTRKPAGKSGTTSPDHGPEIIVIFPVLRIREHIIGLSRPLKSVFCLGVSRVLIRGGSPG